MARLAANSTARGALRQDSGVGFRDWGLGLRDKSLGFRV